jgi:hypothetical protein
LFFMGLSRTVGTRHSTPFGPGRARLTNESSQVTLCEDEGYKPL